MHIIVFWTERGVRRAWTMHGAMLRLTPREGQPRQRARTHARTPCAAARPTREHVGLLCVGQCGVQTGAHQNTHAKGAAANVKARCTCSRGPTKAMGTHAHTVRKRGRLDMSGWRSRGWWSQRRCSLSQKTRAALVDVSQKRVGSGMQALEGGRMGI